MLLIELELWMDGGGGCGGGGSIGAEASLAVLLLISIGSGFTMGGCDMTTGCGADGADVFMIGLICVDPTFIVGVDCCIVLLTAAVFNIFAVTQQIKTSN